MSVYLINHTLVGGSSAPLYSMGWHRQNNVTQCAKSLVPDACYCSQQPEYDRATKQEGVSYTTLLTCIKNVCIKKCISPAAFNRTLTEDFSHSYDFPHSEGTRSEGKT